MDCLQIVFTVLILLLSANGSSEREVSMPPQMKYFSKLQPWLEPKYGLVAQSPDSNYDPGDTAQREGMVMVGAYILWKSGKMSDAEFMYLEGRYQKVLSLLNDPNHKGLLRRYPDPTYWGGLSDRLSRDQSIPNVIAMGFVERFSLGRFYDAHQKYSWGWFMTNTRRNWAWPPGHPEYDAKKYRWKIPDITIMSFTGSYIRAFKQRDAISKIRLWFYDLDTLVGTISKVHSYGKNPNASDDLSHIMNLYQAEIESPTLISKLAFWYYFKNRPFPAPPIGREVPKPTNPAQACMNQYFATGNAGPKLEVFYEDVNKYMAETFTWKLKGKFE
jgi:hypothetical protein